jgi:hypothetical protein
LVLVRTLMSDLGHLRRLGDVRATSGFPRITAEKADIPCRRRPLINCRTDRTSRDSTLVLVQSCSVPKAIEFFLDAPSDLPPAGSKLVETLEVGGALGRRQV